MPLLKMDFMSRVLALAEPVPFTVAILTAKSLLREGVGDMLYLTMRAGRKPRAALAAALGLKRSSVDSPAIRVTYFRLGATARRTFACPRQLWGSAPRTGHSERTDPRP